MKILLICHDFEPISSPCSMRWSAIARQWALDKHSVDVICAQQGEPTARKKNQMVKVFAVGSRNLMRAKYAKQQEQEGITQNYSPLWRCAKAFYKKTWRQLYWPDKACLWYAPALRKAIKLIKNEHYHAYVTVSHPMTCHRIGLTLKSYFPQLPWLMDIGDPFSFMSQPAINNFSRYQLRNRILETKALLQSDVIVVNNSNCKNSYIEKFPEAPASKIKVIPPVLSIKDPLNKRQPRLNAIVRWLFIGTLSQDIRNPLFLLRLFSAVQDCEQQLHCYGQVNNCLPYFLEFMDQHHSQIFLHGNIPHDKIPELLAGADILVNIGNKNSYQCQSKIVEYIASGKPVLHISNCETDASIEYLACYPSLLILHNRDDQPTQEQINQFSAFLRHLPKKLSEETIQNLISPYTVETISQEYQCLLENISKDVAYG